MTQSLGWLTGLEKDGCKCPVLSTSLVVLLARQILQLQWPYFGLVGWLGFSFCYFRERASLCNADWFPTFTNPLSQPPNCWDNDDQPPCLAISGLWLASSSQYSFLYSSDWTSICYRKTAFANIRKPATCAPVDRIRDGNTKDMGCCKRSGPAFRPTTRLT